MTIGVRNVRVGFGDTIALDDVTVAVPARSVVAVVGGDGAGKSTLLRVLAREIAVTSGDVTAPGKSEIGYLPAGPGSWGALSVRQNLDFVAGIHGLDRAVTAQRREERIDRAGLRTAADRPASALSGGMRRKLGAAMAMIHRPQLLLLDEPSTGVDPVSRIDLWRMISECAAAGTAVLMSTTYLDEAERAAHLVVLERGSVLTAGSFDDVRSRFAGTITVSEHPVRPEWSWRRGRQLHEYWPAGKVPDGIPPDGTAAIQPDLEDIVIALSLEYERAQQRVGR